MPRQGWTQQLKHQKRLMLNFGLTSDHQEQHEPQSTSSTHSLDSSFWECWNKKEKLNRQKSCNLFLFNKARHTVHNHPWPNSWTVTHNPLMWHNMPEGEQLEQEVSKRLFNHVQFLCTLLQRLRAREYFCCPLQGSWGPCLACSQGQPWFRNACLEYLHLENVRYPQSSSGGLQPRASTLTTVWRLARLKIHSFNTKILHQSMTTPTVFLI